MNRPASTSRVLASALCCGPLVAVAALVLAAAAAPWIRAEEPAVEVGPAAARSGDGIPVLILSARGKPGVRTLHGSPADGFSPRRIASVILDFAPHFDMRFAAKRAGSAAG